MRHVTPAPKPHIVHVHRAGSQAWRVVLSCGHRLTVLKAEMARLQWFIGRPVDCPDCAAGKVAEK